MIILKVKSKETGKIYDALQVSNISPDMNQKNIDTLFDFVSKHRKSKVNYYDLQKTSHEDNPTTSQYKIFIGFEDESFTYPISGRFIVIIEGVSHHIVSLKESGYSILNEKSNKTKTGDI